MHDLFSFSVKYPHTFSENVGQACELLACGDGPFVIQVSTLGAVKL